MIIKCTVCEISFNKKPYEIKKTERKGGKHCCSRKCASQLAVKAKHPNINTEFGYYVKACRRKTADTNITYNYLEELYKGQNMSCVYTKVPLKLRSSTDIVENPVYTASLDRIDSSIGYIKGNVQFISLSINYAKNRYDEKYIYELIRVIKKYIIRNLTRRQTTEKYYGYVADW